jgi:hypothetical protein
MERLKDEILRRERADHPLLPNTATLQITPECAKWALETRKHVNRPIREKTVARIVRDIEANEYYHNGQTIVFGRQTNGEFVLLTGQHRFAAVILADRSIVSEVNFSASIRSQISMDNTPTRKAGETIGIAHPGLVNASDCATVARYVFWLNRGYELWSHNTLHRPVSSIEIEQIFNLFPEIETSVRFGRSAATGGVGMATLLAVIHLHISQTLEQPTLANLLMESIKTGADMNVTNPVYQLREYIKKSKTSRSATTVVTREAKIKALTLCVNAFLRGRPIRSMGRTLNSMLTYNNALAEAKKLNWTTEGPKIIRQAKDIMCFTPSHNFAHEMQATG